MEFEKFYEIFKKYGFLKSTFRLKNSKKFQNVWFGVMSNPYKNSELTYWFNCNEDNLKYEFPSVDEFVNAKIFDEKSLKDIWENIEIISLDGKSPYDYIAPHFEQSVIFNCKHKEFSTYEQLKSDWESWQKFLFFPIVALLLSLAYFICSLTIITYDKTKHIIASLIILGLLITFISICFTIADIQRAKKVKQIYSFGKNFVKSDFYKSFVEYYNNIINNVDLQDDFNEDGLFSFGLFESCYAVKIKDAYIVFSENPSTNLEMVFLNNYAKVWNKQNNDIKTYFYCDYKNVEHLLNEIKNELYEAI